MRDQMPFVSIVVLNYNGRHFLEGFFNSATNMDYPKDRYEILFVDNGSSDGSVEFVEEKFGEYVKGDRLPRIRIVRLRRNLGFAMANNLAALIARGEYLAFINNDVVLSRKWLRNLVECAEKNPGSICGSRMLWYAKPAVIIYNGGYMTFFGMPLHYDLYKLAPEASVNNTRREVFYADGCGFIIRRDDFLALGGFNSWHFAYAEDYELSWKAWLFGLRVLVEPRAYFWHKISGTLGEFSPLKTYLLWRNLLYNIVELAHPLLAALMLPLLMLYGLIYNCVFNTIMVFSNKEKRQRRLGSCRAYLHVLRKLGSIVASAKVRRSMVISLLGNRFYQRGIMLYKKGLILGLRDSIREILAAMKRRQRIRAE